MSADQMRPDQMRPDQVRPDQVRPDELSSDQRTRPPASGRLPAGLTAVPTAVLLVLFNLVPLAGVIWWGWQLQTILVLYWLESGVVGVLNVPRMALASGPSAAARGDQTGFRVTSGPTSKALLIPFIIIHYGIFWLVHGVFVMLLPLFAALASGINRDLRPGGSPFDLPAGFGWDWGDVVTGAVGIVLFHVISFVYWELIRHEYERVSPQAQMFSPYRRVVVLHITILAGAFLVGLTGQPVAALAILVALKTAIDLAAHVVEHRRRQTTGG